MMAGVTDLEMVVKAGADTDIALKLLEQMAVGGPKAVTQAGVCQALHYLENASVTLMRLRNRLSRQREAN